MKLNTIIDIILLIVIMSFIFNYIPPSLLLSKTITTGGDTGTHYYPAQYMRDYLLPNFKIIGWSPGWYLGFPMFQFYFPLTFVIMALLSYIIPLQISFKLLTVAGTILLPIVVYFAFRLMKSKFPIPIIASSFTLPFLFMEANSMWGGNIPSTFAGEFSYSFGIALTILYFGFLYKGINENKFIVLNSILLTLIGLSHIYTLWWAGLTSLFFLLIKKDLKKNFIYLLKVNGLAFLLLAFFMLPMIFKLDYTTAYAARWAPKLSEVFPEIFWPFYILSLISLFFIIKDKNKPMLLLLFSIGISVISFYMAPLMGVVDIRFTPFFQLLPLLIAPYAISKIKIKASFLIPIIILLATLIWTSDNITFISSWADWNYKGFESKSLWPQFNGINNFVKGSYNDARVVYEHSPDHNAAGTMRAFENLPLFSGRSTMEGLYMQSSPSSPFVFYTQSEISQVSSCPFPQWHCTSFNIQKGTDHLKMFNVQYFIARSDKNKAALKNYSSEYKLVYSNNPYEIYELINNDNNYVFVPEYQPIFYPKDKNWKNTSYGWFKKDTSVHIVFDKKTTQKSESEKIPIDSNCITNENIKEESIEFTTNCINKPHIIRISYFPNWKVKGADKVYLVSPSFMLVYPKQESVKLYYGKTFIDVISYILTISGILIIIFVVIRKRIINKDDIQKHNKR